MPKKDDKNKAKRITMITMSAREFLKVVKHFPDWMLSQSIMNIRSDASLAVSQKRKIMWAGVFSIFLAVLLPTFDPNTTQTISRQFISPFAAFIISLLVFLQIVFPIRAIVRLELIEQSEFEDLKKFLSLKYQPYRLSDEQSAKENCFKVLQALAGAVKSQEKLVAEIEKELLGKWSEAYKECLKMNLVSANHDLEEALDVFDSHFYCWRMLKLCDENRKFFFPKQNESGEGQEAHPQSSTGFKH